MTESGPFDVIMTGCGPVGAIAANLLGRAGLRTLVLERDTEVYTLPRAIHLDHEVMRILQRAGIVDLVLPILSVPAGTMHIGADGGVIRQLRTPLTSARFGWTSDYFFYQPQLEEQIRAGFSRWPSLDVRFAHEVVAVEQDADAVRVTARDPEGRPIEFEGRYLIACDGASSVIRRAIGVELEDLGFDEPWVVVDALVDGPISFPDFDGVPAGTDLQNTLILIADPARPVSVIPGKGRFRRWECMVLPGEDEQAIVTPEGLARLLGPWTQEARYEILRAVVYRFHALVARHWAKGRIFLAGDAAHQTPPFYGQGLCHGIRDVGNLSWKLERIFAGLSGPALLDSYQPEREPQVRAVIANSIKTGRYICTLDPEAARQRDIELRSVVAASRPGYVDIIAPLTTGVAASGREKGRGARFVQPPVRAQGSTSDALLDDATGGGFVWLQRAVSEGVSLADDTRHVLAGAGARVFGVAAAQGQDADRGAPILTDPSGELLAWLDQHEADAVLLRPDGYVFGLTGAEEEHQMVHDLVRYLEPAGGG